MAVPTCVFRALCFMMASLTTSKLDRKLSKKCGPYLVASFPGACGAAADTTAFATCVDRLVECRVCRMLNATDALAEDCDLFDDAILNSTCP